jgi:hypothetical protein
MFMFEARFLQSNSTTTPKSKMFARRAAARHAESSADDKATLPVMVVSPEMFAAMAPGVADLNIADAEPVTAAQDGTARAPVAKAKKRGMKRKNELSGDPMRMAASEPSHR